MNFKNLFRIAMLLTIGIFITVSCDKNELFDNEADNDVLKAAKLSSDFVELIPEDASTIGNYSLIAGQSITVGQVTLAKNAENLYVQVVADADYLIAETHIYIGDIELIPANKSGNPVIGKFPYSYSDMDTIPEVIHEIPLSEVTTLGCGVDVAVHAVISNEDRTFDETAWGTGEMEKGNLIFAIKASIEPSWGYAAWGVTYGNPIDALCAWANNFGYIQIDLTNFTSDTYAITHHELTYFTLGTVNVELVNNEYLAFTITSASADTVRSTYMYAGDLQGLNAYLGGDCPLYDVFPYIDEEDKPVHYFEVPVSDYITSNGEIVEYEDSDRWVYYIEDITLCN